jgi:hypothetical protein
MLRTRPAKEIIVRMANEIGAFDRMMKIIADKGINILAVSAWVEGDQAVIHLVTDNDARVMDTMKTLKCEAREADVLVTKAPHKPGMLHRISERLAQGGIDIHHLYATASITQEQTRVVFASANNDRAMVLMNAAPNAT